jgi:transposase
MAQEDISKRQLCREEGIGWSTLEKVLSHAESPGYRREAPYPEPKLGPYVARIEQILEEDSNVGKKQRHTAQRIFERLLEEGYEGGYTQVREKVRALKRQRGDVFVPLRHDPGTAQVDVGHALARVGGVLSNICYFVMALPHSDALFVQAFWHARTEMFWEFHRRAFEYFGGVPRRISYDNDTVLVSAIIGTRARRLTEGFLQLQSHYCFEAHFCTVRRANEKGVVEAMVGFARRKFLVPVPQVRDLEDLNALLLEQCRADLERTLRGKTAGKQELLVEDEAAFLPLPAGAFDACQKRCPRVNSLSLVRFDSNDYSVPTCHAHHEVVVKGYVDRVVVCRQGQVIACHDRCWGRGQVCLDPVHYLGLLERKPGALDYGRPFEGWALPECFAVLRARLEAQSGGEGTREYIQVLRLLERHSLAQLTAAVERGLRCNAVIRDAIAQASRSRARMSTFTLLPGCEPPRSATISGTPLSRTGCAPRARVRSTISRMLPVNFSGECPVSFTEYMKQTTSGRRSSMRTLQPGSTAKSVPLKSARAGSVIQTETSRVLWLCTSMRSIV